MGFTPSLPMSQKSAISSRKKRRPLSPFLRRKLPNANA